jgi:hypothetical protein
MLVLASDTAPEYIEFQSIWRLYMQSNLNIDCYFYKGDPNLTEDAILDGDTLSIRIEDTLETVYEKTLRAFKFFVPRLDTYTFVFRTNLSSFVDFDKYIRFCDGLPTTNCCAAVIGYEGNIPFPSGSGFTLSPDIVRRLVQESPAKNVQDDVTIGTALRNWGIQIYRANRLDRYGDEWHWVYPPRNHELAFHHRVKTEDRNKDAQTLFELTRLNTVSPLLFVNRS